MKKTILIVLILNSLAIHAKDTPPLNAKAFLLKNIPNGIYTEFSCSRAVYAFGNKNCSITCKESDKIIFTIVNVKKAFYSRSKDRVGLVVDTFENSNERKGVDSFASFSSEVSCVFNKLEFL